MRNFKDFIMLFNVFLCSVHGHAAVATPPVSDTVTPQFIQDLSTKAQTAVSLVLSNARLNIIEGTQLRTGHCKGAFKVTFHFAGEEALIGKVVTYTPNETSCTMVEKLEPHDEGIGFLVLDPRHDIALSLGQQLKTLWFYYPDFTWDGAFYIYHVLNPQYSHAFYSLNGTMLGRSVGFTLDAVTGDVVLPPH